MKKLGCVVLVALVAVEMAGCGTIPGMSTAVQAAMRPQVEEEQSLDEKYFEPALLAGLTAVSWDKVQELDAQKLLDFYAITRCQQNGAPKTDSPDLVEVPAEEAEAEIQGAFDVSADFLRQAESYDKSKNVYLLEMTAPSPVSAKVTDAQITAGRHLALSFEYYSPQDGWTVVREGTLHIELELTEQGFRYLSCESTDKLADGDRISESEALRLLGAWTEFGQLARESGYVYDDPETETVVNASVVRRWAENYQAGRADSFVLLVQEGVVPAVYVVTCSGRPEYTVKRYAAQEERRVYRWNRVTQGDLRYVFSGEGEDGKALVIHRELGQKIFREEPLTQPQALQQLHRLLVQGGVEEPDVTVEGPVLAADVNGDPCYIYEVGPPARRFALLGHLETTAL